MINKKSTPAVKAIEKSGMTGANALWDGPLNTDKFPKGKGSSSGKDGMEVSKYPTAYKAEPITQCAKVYK
jgi:hypothetical protein